MTHDENGRRHRGACGHARPLPGARRHRRHHRLTPGEEIARLEARQRDFEQRVADVAARIKELRGKETAEAPEEADVGKE